jgi:ketopantoate reductase
MASRASNVLVVGSGGVGTIMAYNLQLGGLANVSCILRSNYKAVSEHGFNIDSCDYGKIEGWKPKNSEYARKHVI